MPKTLTEIRSLARSHTKTALNVLVGVMRSKDATATARVSSPNVSVQLLTWNLVWTLDGYSKISE